jgi:ubiquinone/menaquinone biosynthesis C-methylase UbiE
VASAESERRYGRVFDQIAEAYDEVRPSYPSSLVEVAMERGDLEAGSHVLEVGSGTGKLTERLVERGLLVDAVDPGPNMIATARKRLGPTEAVEFHLGRFEDVDLPKQAFDAVFSATAFHWVDPEVSWAKAASHLKPRGTLSLLTHRAIRDEQSAEIHDEFMEVLRAYVPELVARWRPPQELDVLLAGARERRGNPSEVWDWVSWARDRLAVPAAAELFEDAEVATELWTLEETADELLAHFRTTSLYYRIEPDRRAALEDDHRRLVERHGGTIRTTRAAVLMTARRR